MKIGQAKIVFLLELLNPHSNCVKHQHLFLHINIMGQEHFCLSLLFFRLVFIINKVIWKKSYILPYINWFVYLSINNIWFIFYLYPVFIHCPNFIFSKYPSLTIDPLDHEPLRKHLHPTLWLSLKVFQVNYKYFNSHLCC